MQNDACLGPPPSVAGVKTKNFPSSRRSVVALGSWLRSLVVVTQNMDCARHKQICNVLAPPALCVRINTRRF